MCTALYLNNIVSGYVPSYKKAYSMYTSYDYQVSMGVVTKPVQTLLKVNGI